MKRHAFWFFSSALLTALPAAAQSCPSAYAACDNGGCCLSAEQCCPSMADGCCSAATPYCCGDGTCAARPSECASATRAICDGYDVPCGEGCAPAGSDCCDSAGHYCSPESRCTSETTCVRGDMPTLALLVAVPAREEEAARARSAAPFADPPDASDRSCSLQPPHSRQVTMSSWLLLFGVVALVMRRR